MKPSPGILSISQVLTIAVSLLVIAAAVYRDYGYTQVYQQDLRNRVTGARMIADGKLPYLYRWHTGDSLRYYDPLNAYITNLPDSLVQPSSTTASPFFHQLMRPISNWPQSAINHCWILLHYLVLAALGIMAYTSATTRRARNMILPVIALYLHTIGWIFHITAGQLYIFIPLLAWLIYYLLNRSASFPGTAIPAAIAATVLLLIKPVACLLLVPLLLNFRKYLLFMISTVVLIGIYVLYVLCAPFQSALYRNYREAVKAHISFRQQAAGDSIVHEAGPTVFEGINLRADTMAFYPAIRYQTSNGQSYFTEPNRQFDPGHSVNTMYGYYIALFIFIISGLHMRNKRLPLSLDELFLSGYVLYSLLELFMPVYRFPYYPAQLIFGLLLFGTTITARSLFSSLLITTGLLFNILFQGFFPIWHTGGEMLILAGFAISTILPQKIFSPPA